MDGGAIHLSYPLSFLAGLVSFLSPCVFPLVPVYAGYLSGRAGEPALGGTGNSAVAMRGGTAALRQGPGAVTVTNPGWRVPIIANGVVFVLGFSTVFVTLFYILRALDVTVVVQHRSTVDLVAGILVILLALQTIGLLRVGLLMRDSRRLRAPMGVGLVSSFILGVTFAAGWTPCIGPQLTAILAVANQGDFTGLPVMLAYCLGLGVPFLVVAALTDRLQGPIRALNRHLGAVNLVSGGLLLVFGVLLATGKITQLDQYSFTSPFNL